MVRDILIWPHPVLSTNAAPVARVDEETRKLVADMFETMYDAQGVGLAAPQIGVSQRVVVIDTRPRQPESRPLALINPEIVAREGSIRFMEACLSIPGEAEEVERAERVTVRYLDEQGDTRELECDGLLAIAVQHETDHLDGTVYVERINTLKRELIRQRMKRVQAERRDAPVIPNVVSG